MRDELATGDPRRDDVIEILGAAERARALTGQLLAFSRRQPIQPRLVDLGAAVRGFHKLLRRTVREDIELAVLTQDRCWPVRVDPGQVEQVLMNLAVNAAQSMPHGGCITIEVKNHQLAQARDPLAEGDYVMLQVGDTGSGITPEHLRRIFEPFFTTKAAGEGTGLGLATCYGIVRQAGGDIQVDSAPGAGARFSVMLPRQDGAPDPAAWTPRRRDSDALDGTETILVVEDVDSVRRAIARILEQRGYAVLAAQNGDEALRLATHHTGPIDLVITDIVMPQVSGRELASRLAVSHPTTLVVFMTGYAEHAVPGPATAASPVNVVFKPFVPDDLLRTIRDVLDRGHDRPAPP